MITPTFFINSRRYDGPWDESSFSDALLGHARPSRAHGGARFRRLGAVGRHPAAAGHGAGGGPDQFRRWGRASTALWQQYLGVSFGDASFRMSLLHWVNDGLLTIFFLVVGLEIKREFTVGHLASLRSAALPIAAAIGGMVVPALLYFLRHSGRALGARLGRADGDRHRLRGGADRHDGTARSGRAAHLSDRRGDRRRHRRDHRCRDLLFGRAEPALSGGGRGASSRCWRCSTARASTAWRLTF